MKFKNINGIRIALSPSEKLAAKPSIKDLQLTYRDRVNDWRIEEESKGVLHAGHMWNTTQSSLDKITHVLSTHGKSGPAPVGFYWTDADDIDVPMPLLDDLASLSKAMVARGFGIHKQQRQAKASIKEANNIGELDAVLQRLNEPQGTQNDKSNGASR